jgi:hypothetical protein
MTFRERVTRRREAADAVRRADREREWEAFMARVEREVEEREAA